MSSLLTGRKTSIAIPTITNAIVDQMIPRRLEHADGPLEPLTGGLFLLQSSLIVLLRIAHDPTPLVGEIEPYALLVAQRDHEVGVGLYRALRQLYGLAPTGPASPSAHGAEMNAIARKQPCENHPPIAVLR